MSEFQPLDSEGLAGGDGVVCSHCGYEAVAFDDQGDVPPDSGDRYCAECGIAGVVVHELGEDGGVLFMAYPSVRCERDVCDTCEVP